VPRPVTAKHVSLFAAFAVCAAVAVAAAGRDSDPDSETAATSTTTASTSTTAESTTVPDAATGGTSADAAAVRDALSALAVDAAEAGGISVRFDDLAIHASLTGDVVQIGEEATLMYAVGSTIYVPYSSVGDDDAYDFIAIPADDPMMFGSGDGSDVAAVARTRALVPVVLGRDPNLARYQERVAESDRLHLVQVDLAGVRDRIVNDFGISRNAATLGLIDLPDLAVVAVVDGVFESILVGPVTITLVGVDAISFDPASYRVLSR
jgi:hypothetical protein